MELRQLEHFVAVAEEQHFTRAAARLHIGQAGLSSSIRHLEDELETELFKRSTRNVKLTESGHALFFEARRTIASAEAAKEAVKQAAGFPGGALKIGSTPAFGGIDLPSVQLELMRRYPDLQTRITIGDADVLLDAVLKGTIDIALLTLPQRLPAGLTAWLLQTSEMVVIAPRNHPLAERESILFGELNGHTFVDFPVNSVLRIMSDSAFVSSASTRKISCTANHVYELSTLVACGAGLALIPATLVLPGVDVAVIRLTDRSIVWSLAAAVRSTRALNSATAELLRLVSVDRPDSDGGLPIYHPEH